MKLRLDDDTLYLLEQILANESARVFGVTSTQLAALTPELGSKQRRDAITLAVGCGLMKSNKVEDANGIPFISLDLDDPDEAMRLVEARYMVGAIGARTRPSVLAERQLEHA